MTVLTGFRQRKASIASKRKQNQLLPGQRPSRYRFCGMLLAILGALLVLALFCYWQNNRLIVSEYQYHSDKISAQLNGFTIAQIADLHNKDFHGRLEQLLAAETPDLIVITGDLIDCRHTNLEVALSFVQAALELAPVYIVSGNHEHNAGADWTVLQQRLVDLGAVMLDDTGVTVNHNGGSFQLLGIADPAFGGDAVAAIAQNLQPDQFNILLAHRPERIDQYATTGVDLVLSGHAHGGQWRLPGLGGLIAPGQGFFPRYTDGLYQVGDTSLLVSRGLGNSVMPLRLFNQPQLVILQLLI